MKLPPLPPLGAICALLTPLAACSTGPDLDDAFSAANEAETSLPAANVCEYFAYTGKSSGPGQYCNDLAQHPIYAGMEDPTCNAADDDENGVRYTCVEENGRLVWYRSLCKLDILGPDFIPIPHPNQIPNECLSDAPNYVRKDSFRGPILNASGDPQGGSQGWLWDGDWDVWYDNSGEATAQDRQNDASQDWGEGKSIEINTDDTDALGQPRDHGVQVMALDRGSFGLKRSFAGDLRGKTVVMHYSLRLRAADDSGAWAEVLGFENGEYAEALAKDQPERDAHLAASQLWVERGSAMHTNECVELEIPATGTRPVQELRFKIGANAAENHQLNLYELYVEDDPAYRGHSCPSDAGIEDFTNAGIPVPFQDPRTQQWGQWIYDADWSHWFDNTGSTNESSQGWGTGYGFAVLDDSQTNGVPGGQGIFITEGSFGLKRVFERDLRGSQIELDFSAQLEALGGPDAGVWMAIMAVDSAGNTHHIYSVPHESVVHGNGAVQGQRISLANQCVSEWVSGAIATPVHELRIKVGAFGDTDPNAVILHELRTGEAATGCTP